MTFATRKATMMTATATTTAIDLLRRYREVRAATEQLAAPLHPEDQVVQSMPDTSPTKWHRAHVTWFFETFVLSEHLDGYEEFHPQFRVLFNSYYEQVGDKHPRPQRGLLSRPTVDEVTAYRAHVDAAMGELLLECDDPDVWSLIELGLHHEQQHQELLLMDIKHVLSVNPLQPAYRVGMGESGANPPPLRWIEFPGGLVEIGHTGDGFSFDHEGPRHTTYLRPYTLADRLVTNGEWLAFIDDGGYQRSELWLSDGWATVLANDWKMPLYWRKDEQWTVFTLAGTQAVRLDEPVCHVSYYEADAYAHWAGARLATEAEWEVAARDHTPDGANLLAADVLHPDPPPAGDGLRQLFGDVWEWTSSAYLAYPGYRAPEGAVGEYNGKFMSGQMVLRGGCAVTPPDHVRATYRNFFPPQARWAFSGVRLAR
jgi:ergothioneine biosynthesis protein EgtB